MDGLEDSLKLGVLRCSVVGDRDLWRVALELADIAEQQNCEAIELWRGERPASFYYVSTLRQFQRPHEATADLDDFLYTYRDANHIRGRQCRGRRLDSLLDSLAVSAASATDKHAPFSRPIARRARTIPIL